MGRDIQGLCSVDCFSSACSAINKIPTCGVVLISNSSVCDVCVNFITRGVEYAGCGKRGLWKSRGVNNAWCGKRGVWKTRRLSEKHGGKRLFSPEYGFFSLK